MRTVSCFRWIRRLTLKVANKLQLVGVVTMYNIFVIAAYGNSKLVQVSLLCMSLGIHHHIFSLMLPSICKKFPLKQATMDSQQSCYGPGNSSVTLFRCRRHGSISYIRGSIHIGHLGDFTGHTKSHRFAVLVTVVHMLRVGARMWESFAALLALKWLLS